VKAEFSEFTYGFSVIRELSEKYSFSEVPIFPSLIDEGKIGGGYDVNAEIEGIPFFLQFKLSEYLERASSLHYGTFLAPYYRFKLHKNNGYNQHNLLVQLEKQGNPVFYTAPAFREKKILSLNYFNKDIVKNSIWISPLDIGSINDTSQHYVCFEKSLKRSYFFSEPVTISNKLNFDENDDNHPFVKYLETFEVAKTQTWEQLYYQMLSMIKNLDRKSYILIKEYSRKHLNYQDKVKEISLLFFGTEILLFNIM
jgi:hypothetical protein